MPAGPTRSRNCGQRGSAPLSTERDRVPAPCRGSRVVLRHDPHPDAAVRSPKIVTQVQSFLVSGVVPHAGRRPTSHD